MKKFQTRESFAAAVSEVFTSERSRFRPQHWACYLEQHSDDGFHYHMALKLTGPKKWLESKRALQRKHGIVVNFSDHDGYYTAYRYISKYMTRMFTTAQIIPNWTKSDPPKRRTVSVHIVRGAQTDKQPRPRLHLRVMKNLPATLPRKR